MSSLLIAARNTLQVVLPITRTNSRVDDGIFGTQVSAVISTFTDPPPAEKQKKKRRCVIRFSVLMILLVGTSLLLFLQDQVCVAVWAPSVGGIIVVRNI